MSAENKALSRRLLEEAFNAGNIAVVDELSLPTSSTTTPLSLSRRLARMPPKRASRATARRSPTCASRSRSRSRAVILSPRVGAPREHTRASYGNGRDGQAGDCHRDHDRQIVDGRIAESWTNWDTLGMLQQLGVVPALVTA